MELNETNRVMSDHDLSVLGLQFVAYVKPVAVQGSTAYSIHAADGTEIAVMDDRALALAAIRSHDLEPVCVN
jgi:hypothetical protein